ncbi:MAG: hypothetical protein KDA88_04085 [Planctomycetaceae bacterium]|nr:hypothetical protein [Planctomycetaceae bacterium]
MAWLNVYRQAAAEGLLPIARAQSPQVFDHAPEQFPQHSFFPAGHSIYQQAQVEEILEYAPLRESRIADTLEEDTQPAIQPVQYPFEPSGGVDGDWVPDVEERLSVPPAQPASRWSKQIFQTTVLPGSGDTLGMFEIDSRATTSWPGFPLLQVTPRFAFRTLTGPVSTDLPGTLFDLSLDATFFLPVSTEWSFLFSLSPGIYSDFDAYSRDSLRIPGRAFAIYKWSDSLKLVGGLIYLDRQDIGFLPAAGLTYTPNDDLKFDVSFPKPKISWRYLADTQRERFLYIAGEFWGGTWTVERASGKWDKAAIGDLRLLVGWEHKQADQLHWNVEAGYVFNRKVEYASGLGDLDLGDTAVLRFAIGY